MLHIFVGTKAQIIKMAPIMRELKSRGIDYNYISSGQHRETIDELIECFEIKPPDYVAYSGKDITSIPQMLWWSIRVAAHCWRNKRDIFRSDQNGAILNHGDTFSTLLGAVIGRLAGLTTVHIESGLRSFNILHPFPEELTRLMVFRLSDWYFAPGSWAADNLRRYSGTTINTETNTLVDALRVATENFDRCSVAIPDGPFGVVSLHRFENIFKRERLEQIVEELNRVSADFHLIFILHLPTEKKLKKFGLYEVLKQNPNIELRPRYDYLNFIRLIDASEFVISDGGSNQEECSYLGKPCLLFRKTTERQDGIGENAVVSNYDTQVIQEFLRSYKSYQRAPVLGQQYPSKLIVDTLKEYH